MRRVTRHPVVRYSDGVVGFLGVEECEVSYFLLCFASQSLSPLRIGGRSEGTWMWRQMMERARKGQRRRVVLIEANLTAALFLPSLSLIGNRNGIRCTLPSRKILMLDLISTRSTFCFLIAFSSSHPFCVFSFSFDATELSFFFLPSLVFPILNSIYHPAYNLDLEDASSSIDRFSTHINAVGGSVQSLREVVAKTREGERGSFHPLILFESPPPCHKSINAELPPRSNRTSPQPSSSRDRFTWTHHVETDRIKISPQARC